MVAQLGVQGLEEGAGAAGEGGDPPPLGRLRLVTRDSEFTVHCDALAVTGWRTAEVKLLSVAGSGTAIKAIAAALHKGSGVRFEPEDCGDLHTYRGYQPVGKWECFRSHLGLGTYHLVAWTREEGFLSTVSREALRRLLIGTTITTPILATPEWLDFIERRLRDGRRWTDYQCFGCRCAHVLLCSEVLDQIVTEGVQSGKLSFA